MAERHVRASTPRGFAHCEKCHERLSYEYGSIMWRCQTEDLCPSCAAKAAVEQIRTLVGADIGLWMDTEMKAFEVINPVAHPFHHGGEKPAQGIRFITPFDLCDPAILNRKTNRLREVGGNADVPRPPAQHAVKNKDAGCL